MTQKTWTDLLGAFDSSPVGWEEGYRMRMTTTKGKLPSERNSAAMERRIKRAVKALGYRGDLVFEHGHWWLTLPDGSIFDVVDAEGGKSVDGFDLERVS